MPGKEVRVRRIGQGVLLEPLERDAGAIQSIFDKLEQYHDIPFMEGGR